MADYIYIEDALPELGYNRPTPPEFPCCTCKRGQVSNAGAIIPGLTCTLAEELFEKKGMEDEGNAQVNATWGTCLFHSSKVVSNKKVIKMILDKGAR